MPSQLITPPDRIHSKHAFLIINAIDTSIETLVLWLQTVHDEYDLHLYHSKMITYHDWAIQIAEWVPKILVEINHTKYINARLQTVIDRRSDSVTYFGPGTEYSELVQYFLRNRIE